MKLTQTAIDRLALPHGVADKIFFDDEMPGFGVRLREGGSRKFVVHYRMGSKQRRQTLGAVAVLTLEQARQKARKVLVAVGDGRDPAADKASARAASSLLFSAVADSYLTARQPDMKVRPLAEVRRYLKNHCKALHKIAIGKVERSLVASTLRTIATDHGPIAANRARSAISSMYAWAIGEGLCESNPVIGTNKATEERARDRVLTDAELTKIWLASGETPFGRIVRLLMLTGQRRDEIGDLHWSEITSLDDASKAQIELQGPRTKNSRAHVLPLPPAAIEVLKAQPQIVGRDLVFGEGEGGYSGWSRSKAALDVASGVTGWTLHDLRRTAATRMADLGVQPHVIEAVLNHVSGHKAGVAGIYNRSTYAGEKRAALALWASHVAIVVAQAQGANVAVLGRGKRTAA